MEEKVMRKKKFDLQQRKLISAFCGINAEPSEATCRKIKPLESILQSLVGNAIQKSERVGILRDLWNSIVGDDLAKFSTVRSVYRQTLYIDVKNGTVLQELKFEEQQILETVAKISQIGNIKRLQITLVS
jgi:hypothetical protein